MVWLPTGVEFEAVAVAIAGADELTARALSAPAASFRVSTALERAVTSVFNCVSAELCPWSICCWVCHTCSGPSRLVINWLTVEVTSIPCPVPSEELSAFRMSEVAMS
jgi:hypothetical protein